MSKILELRKKRNALWEQTKAYLEEHRDSNDLVDAASLEQYNRMVSDVQALGNEIKRLEDQMELDAKLAAPTSNPVHQEPMKDERKDPVRATATAKYSEAFWNMMRGNNTMEVRGICFIAVAAVINL